MSRPKDLGTQVETAFVRYAISAGFLGAERRPLAGAKDLADVRLCPGVIVECKRAMGSAGVKLVPWMRETIAEFHNSRDAHENPQVAFLVAKPAGLGDRNVGLWFAAVPSECWGPLDPHLGIGGNGSAARVNASGGLVDLCRDDPYSLSRPGSDWNQAMLGMSRSLFRRGLTVELRRLGTDCVVGPVWWVLLGLRAAGYGDPLPKSWVEGTLG